MHAICSSTDLRKALSATGGGGDELDFRVNGNPGKLFLAGGDANTHMVEVCLPANAIGKSTQQTRRSSVRKAVMHMRGDVNVSRDEDYIVVVGDDKHGVTTENRAYHDDNRQSLPRVKGLDKEVISLQGDDLLLLSRLLSVPVNQDETRPILSSVFVDVPKQVGEGPVFVATDTHRLTAVSGIGGVNKYVERGFSALVSWEAFQGAARAIKHGFCGGGVTIRTSSGHGSRVEGKGKYKGFTSDSFLVGQYPRWRKVTPKLPTELFLIDDLSVVLDVLESSMEISSGVECGNQPGIMFSGERGTLRMTCTEDQDNEELGGGETGAEGKFFGKYNARYMSQFIRSAIGEGAESATVATNMQSVDRKEGFFVGPLVWTLSVGDVEIIHLLMPMRI